MPKIQRMTKLLDRRLSERGISVTRTARYSTLAPALRGGGNLRRTLRADDNFLLPDLLQ
jgi:hypothetical protein